MFECDLCCGEFSDDERRDTICDTDNGPVPKGEVAVTCCRFCHKYPGYGMFSYLYPFDMKPTLNEDD